MYVYHIHWEWVIFKADINYSIRPVSKEHEFHCKVPGIGKMSCNISCFKEIYIFTRALLYMRHPCKRICIFSPCRVQMRIRFRILNSWNGLNRCSSVGVGFLFAEWSMRGRGIWKLCVQAELIFFPLPTWLWEGFRDLASHEHVC